MDPQQKKISLFIIKLLSIYLATYLLYEYILIPYTTVDNYIISSLLVLSEAILNLLNFDSFINYDSAIVGISGSSGVNVGYACDGLSLFLLFSVFIMIFPGRSLVKLMYTLIGCFIIHFLNSCRIAALAVIHVKQPELLHFHHTYTFTLFIYGVIFMLWVFKVNLYSKKQW
jgi:exosortase/archaeosortase family protein